MVSSTWSDKGPPELFYLALGIFHLFPFHAPLTLFFMDAPFGRFSHGASKLNLNGNLAWFCMEVVAPITFVTTLNQGYHPPLTQAAQFLGVLYVIHYIHRAILSPLVYSPPRSPLHLSIPFAGALFNLLNAYLLADGLLYFPPSTSITSPRFWLAVAGWSIGFVGNVYHDEILNDLRRPEESRLVSSKSKEEEENACGRYKIPFGGLFRYVSFPNYLCEWFEWSSFALAASSSLFIPVPTISSLNHPLAQRVVQTIPLLSSHWPTKMLAPSWMFVLAEITSMLPRAIRGHKWYHDKFGDKYPKERKVVVPGVL